MKKKQIISPKKENKPTFSHLIEKKRDGGEFTDEEVRYIVDSILDEEMPQFQLSALIMAIYFQGMSAQEIASLAQEIMLSGEVLDLSFITSPKIDRYATGGVGDKTAMVLPAVAAAAGVVVPAMIGPEEDFTIHTLEKLSAIPGFVGIKVLKDAKKQLEKANCMIIQPDKELTPVDTILHDLRVQTGTIPSLPLITGSVLSKKLAAGAEGLVVDVKWGNGSYIADLEQAKQLARSLTRVARSMNRRCVALVSDMNQPLGDCVGTGLEVQEAITLLKGNGPEDLRELLLKMGMEVVRLAGVAGSTLSAKQTIERVLKDGSAFQKFKEMIKEQGGDVTYIDNPDKFPKAKHIRKLPAPKRGYVHTINAAMIAQGVKILATDSKGRVDHSVGVSEIKKIGTQVKQGEPLMMIHYNDAERLEAALENLRNAYRLAPKRPAGIELVVERVA